MADILQTCVLLFSKILLNVVSKGPIEKSACCITSIEGLNELSDIELLNSDF